MFRFSFISFASLILLVTLTRMAVVFLRRLHQKIIDDRYLRGMQLHNYENAIHNQQQQQQQAQQPQNNNVAQINPEQNEIAAQ